MRDDLAERYRRAQRDWCDDWPEAPETRRQRPPKADRITAVVLLIIGLAVAVFMIWSGIARAGW